MELVHEALESEIVAELEGPFGHQRCLRCLLLVMCTHPVAKKALMLHLARIEGRECYLGCNLMHRKVLASFHQHLMVDGDVPAAVEFGRVAAAPVNTLRQQTHRCQEISVCF